MRKRVPKPRSGVRAEAGARNAPAHAVEKKHRPTERYAVPKAHRFFKVFGPKQRLFEQFLRRITLGDIAQAPDVDDIERELRIAGAKLEWIPGWLALLGAVNVVLDFKLSVLEGRDIYHSILRDSTKTLRESREALERLQQQAKRQDEARRDRLRAAGRSPKRKTEQMWDPLLQVAARLKRQEHDLPSAKY
jgi:hypothetical protein